MGMYKSVYIGPYIRAKLTDDTKAPKNWYPEYDEGGDEELCSGEVFIPDNSDRKLVGGFSLQDESGVFQLPPVFAPENSALQKALDKFREADPYATLHYGVIVSWG